MMCEADCDARVRAAVQAERERCEQAIESAADALATMRDGFPKRSQPWVALANKESGARDMLRAIRSGS